MMGMKEGEEGKEGRREARFREVKEGRGREEDT